MTRRPHPVSPAGDSDPRTAAGSSPRRRHDAGLPLAITLRTFRQQPLLEPGLLADVVFSILLATDVTLAVCVLPDRVHWLIVGSADWSGRLRRFRSLTTHLAWHCGHSGRLWQPSELDQVERSDEDLQSAAAAVLASPIRGGLVDDLADYRYKYSRWS